MQFTRTANIKYLKTIVVSFFVLIIVIYAVWRSIDYARGPTITIIEPYDGYATTSATIDVVGQTLRSTSLTMNGNMIIVDESGNFRERSVVFKGMNWWTFEVKDQFGRSESKQIRVIGLVVE